MKINNSSKRVNLLLKTGILMSLVFFPFLNALFYPGFLLAFISWLLIIMEKSYNLAYFLSIPFVKELAVLLLLSTISLSYASDLSYGIRYWTMILQAFLSYLMIYESLDSKDVLLKFQQILLIPALVVALYGIVGYLMGNTERAVSFFTNPNYLSVYLLLLIPIALGLITESSLPVFKRFFAAVVFTACSVALLFTMSRGAWLGITTALILFSVIKDRRFLVLLLVIVLLVLLAAPPEVISRMKTIISIKSNMDRIKLWSSTIEMIKDHPVLGVGIGNFRPVYAEYASGKLMIHTHNIFLQFTVELGIAGLLFIIYFLYLLARVALTVLKKYDYNKKGTGAALGTVTSLLALLIDLQFDFQIIDRLTAMLALFLIANLSFLAEGFSPSQAVDK
ncbi:MAG: hypothetical protein GX175_07380 [Halanaerobiaceae bacterium]|nr:hypothetical protein [Halanaerobiaceae bacterium]